MTRLHKRHAIQHHDDSWTIETIIMQNQRSFAKHFLPKYCVGVKSAVVRWSSKDTISIRSRNTPMHRYRLYNFSFDMDQVLIWSHNVKLLDFVGND